MLQQLVARRPRSEAAQRRSADRVGRDCGEVREAAPSGLSMLADAATLQMRVRPGAAARVHSVNEDWASVNDRLNRQLGIQPKVRSAKRSKEIVRQRRSEEIVRQRVLCEIQWQLYR